MEAMEFSAAERAAFEEAAAGPARHLFESMEGMKLPVPTGWHVLVLQYIRPEKVGSIIMAEQTRREDEYQGRVGLVLRMGPEAFTDVGKFPGGPWCKPGVWVTWPRLEASSTRMKYGKVVLALMNDESILMTGVDPVLATQGGS